MPLSVCLYLCVCLCVSLSVSRFRSQMSGTAVDMSSKTHLSFWMRCVACTTDTNIQIKLSPARIKSTFGPITPEWVNYKIAFDSMSGVIGEDRAAWSNVDHIAFSIADASAGVLEVISLILLLANCSMLVLVLVLLVIDSYHESLYAST